MNIPESTSVVLAVEGTLSVVLRPGQGGRMQLSASTAPASAGAAAQWEAVKYESPDVVRAVVGVPYQSVRITAFGADGAADIAPGPRS